MSSSKDSLVAVNSTTTTPAGHIQVYCRVRPLPHDIDSSLSFPGLSSDEIRTVESIKEVESAQKTLAKALLQQNPALIMVGDKSTFAVDRVFHYVTQDEVFQETLYPILEHDVFQGIHCTLFSYGQTGSGKTHTLLGHNHQATDEQGLLPRAMEHIFQKIADLSRDNIHYSCIIKLSIVEIYHEKLKDLLATNTHEMHHSSSSSANSLVIREQQDGTIWVEHLREVSIKSMEEFKQLLAQGLKKRVVGGHKLNELSSRSHLCCLLQMLQIDKEKRQEIFSKLSIIDLAGSEMVSLFLEHFLKKSNPLSIRTV